MDHLSQIARDVRFARRVQYDVPFSGKTLALALLLSPILLAATAPLWGWIGVFAWRVYAGR